MLSTKNIQAQIPINDTAWVLQTSMSDDFNAGTLNNTMWDTTYCYWNNSTCYNVSNGAEWDFGRNISMTSTTLKIKADTLSSNKIAAWGTFPDSKYGDTLQSLTYVYQGGVVKTKSTLSYTAGYVEARIKFPSHKWPLWPAFWLYGAGNNCCGGGYSNEVDIAENWALLTKNGYQTSTNYHIDNTCSGPCNNDLYNGEQTHDVIPTTDSLSGAFHKFAVQWNTQNMIFYFDDKVIRTVTDLTGASIPQYSMGVIFDFVISPYDAILPNNWDGKVYSINPITHLPIHGNKTPTQWPQYLEVDYMHYYTLPTACTTTLNICTLSNYSGRKVQKSITVGGSTCTPTFSPTNKASSYTLRATDFVELDAGTQINAPTGTGYFAIEVMACP